MQCQHAKRKERISLGERWRSNAAAQVPDAFLFLALSLHDGAPDRNKIFSALAWSACSDLDFD